jgi:hypothetical protein
VPRDWRSVFQTWSKPLSDTEQTKADNAARIIQEAVRSHPSLRARDVAVFPTGSYRNRTNVRADSDVDIAVVLKGTFFAEYEGGLTRDAVGTSDVMYGMNDFREDVGSALVARVGRGVTPGDKAFDVHENTYRLDADVAAFLEHRRYTGRRTSSGEWEYYSGVEMRPRSDRRKRIINWHQQHYDNGVRRNDETGRRFKRVARILKRLRNEMSECGDAQQRAAAHAAPSFLLECLAYSAPDESFTGDDTYYSDVKAVIASMWNKTKPDEQEQYSKLVEVSGMKWLFRPSQPWTPEQAHEFLLRAWQYVGFP